MTKSVGRWLVGLAVLVAGTGAVAQPAPDREFGEELEVTEVLLDLVVTDRKGSVVSGLGRDDFVVEENGEKVEIADVTYYTTRYASPAPGETAVAVSPGEPVPASRYFVFFFHDQRRIGSPQLPLVQRQLEASRASGRWLEKNMGPSDWVAVVSYDVRLKIQQDFTQDLQLLLQAIEDAATASAEPRPWFRPADPTRPSLLAHLPEDAALGRETTTPYDALRLLPEATGHIVGRKNVLLFTIGFGEVDGISPGRPDRRYYPATERALNDNNVAVYPIDLVPAGTDHAQRDFLETLADDTGGRTYSGFVSFSTPLDQIADENVGYYLLSYRSRHEADESGYQEVKVKATRRGVKVRSRRGYRFGPDDG